MNIQNAKTADYIPLSCIDFILEIVCEIAAFGSTVVPVMNRHPRDQAKVSVHCRWPLVTGTDGQAGMPNIMHIAITHTTITTSDIPDEYTHCHNYVSYS